MTLRQQHNGLSAVGVAQAVSLCVALYITALTMPANRLVAQEPAAPVLQPGHVIGPTFPGPHARGHAHEVDEDGLDHVRGVLEERARDAVWFGCGRSGGGSSPPLPSSTMASSPMHWLLQAMLAAICGANGALRSRCLR